MYELWIHDIEGGADRTYLYAYRVIQPLLAQQQISVEKPIRDFRGKFLPITTESWTDADLSLRVAKALQRTNVRTHHWKLRKMLSVPECCHCTGLV